MHYKIRVEGGFTGIPKEYIGERTFGQNELEPLLEAMEHIKPHNEQLRDGLKYFVELREGKRVFSVEFDEGNLPSEIREFIVRITKSDKS